MGYGPVGRPQAGLHRCKTAPSCPLSRLSVGCPGIDEASESSEESEEEKPAEEKEEEEEEKKAPTPQEKKKKKGECFGEGGGCAAGAQGWRSLLLGHQMGTELHCVSVGIELGRELGLLGSFSNCHSLTQASGHFPSPQVGLVLIPHGGVWGRSYEITLRSSGRCYRNPSSLTLTALVSTNRPPPKAAAEGTGPFPVLPHIPPLS